MKTSNQEGRVFRLLSGTLLSILALGIVLLWLPSIGQPSKLVVADLWGAMLAGVATIVSFRAASHGDAATKRGWLWIGFGTLAWFGGEAIWGYFEVIRGTEAPFPSVADICYVAAYPIFLAGMLSLAIPPRSIAWVRTMIDATVVTLLAAAPLWVYVLEPIATDSEATSVEIVLSLSYPIGDLLLVFGLATAALRRMGERSGLVLGSLASGLVLFLAADLAFAILSQSDAYESGSILDAGWMTGYALIGIAALLQTRWQTSTAREDAARLAPPWRQVVPQLLLLPLLAWVIVADVSSSGIIQGILLAAICLVILRSILGLTDVLLLNRELDQTAGKLDEANKELAANGRLLNKLLVEAVALSRRDSLTGLLNHASIIDELSIAMTDHPDGVVIAMLDVDNMKAINDQEGHQAGDDALRAIARRLNAVEELTAGRYGGDEFLVFMVSPGAGLAPLETQLDEAISALLRDGISLCQGTAAFPTDADEATELIARADQRLYRAKRARSLAPRQTAA